MRKILIIILFSLFICGCNNKEIIDNNSININEIKEIMKNNEYVILDVRTKEEYAEGHIVDSINIPYDKINKEINIGKNNIIFVYCKSGNRSKIAFEVLNNLGYIVYDLGAYSLIDLPKE